jgi:hypothetical protein
MDLLPERYKVITATVDGSVDEIGAVYQAAGFDYVGQMRQGGRVLVALNGKLISERQAGRIAGTRGAQALARVTERQKSAACQQGSGHCNPARQRPSPHAWRAFCGRT